MSGQRTAWTLLQKNSSTSEPHDDRQEHKYPPDETALAIALAPSPLARRREKRGERDSRGDSLRTGRSVGERPKWRRSARKRKQRHQPHHSHRLGDARSISPPVLQLSAQLHTRGHTCAMVLTSIFARFLTAPTLTRAVLKTPVRFKIPQEILLPKGQPRKSQKELHEALQASTLPKLPIASTGSIYDTRQRRVVPLQDPNAPEDWWGHRVTVGLKWTDWRMLKDVRRRHIFTHYHPLRENLRLVQKGYLLPLELANSAHRSLAVDLPKYSSISWVRMRCCVSSRGRGKLYYYRLSRFVFRHLADYNKLSGVQRSMWGP